MKMRLQVFSIIAQCVFCLLTRKGVLAVDGKKEKQHSKSIIVYQAVFQNKRAQQLEAVKTMTTFKYEQQYSLLTKLLTKSFEVLAVNKLFLERVGYIPGLTEMQNDTVKEALFQVLETTTMYSEFQLKLPDVTDRVMALHPPWLVFAKWAIGFSNASGLFDTTSTRLINLVDGFKITSYVVLANQRVQIT